MTFPDLGNRIVNFFHEVMEGVFPERLDGGSGVAFW